MVKIAVLGYGTVGSGVVEVLGKNSESIAKRAEGPIEVKYVLDLRDFPGDPIQEKIVHDYDIILKDEEIRIVVEVMGGVNPAYSFVKSALMAGKNVATSNKELVARHGAELLNIAREYQVNFMFEASVGGGIPIIRPLMNSLTADEITEITGILNGTTNYMLTKMANEGLKYEDILKRAQEKGYAERNPEADVEGYDAGRKIAILASMAFGKQVDFEDIYTEGISRITDVDFKYAAALGKVIKLLGTCRKEGDRLYAMVSPVMIGDEHPLYNVNGVFNAVFVHGTMLGDTMFYGRGAGKLPTASAVVADIIEEAKHLNTNIYIHWSPEKLKLNDMHELSHRFFVRITGNASEVLVKVKAVFNDITLVNAEGINGEFGFVTGNMTEAEFDEKLADLSGVIHYIRCCFTEE